MICLQYCDIRKCYTDIQLEDQVLQAQVMTKFEFRFDLFVSAAETQ